MRPWRGNTPCADSRLACFADARAVRPYMAEAGASGALAVVSAVPFQPDAELAQGFLAQLARMLGEVGGGCRDAPLLGFAGAEIAAGRGLLVAGSIDARAARVRAAEAPCVGACLAPTGRRPEVAALAAGVGFPSGVWLGLFFWHGGSGLNLGVGRRPPMAFRGCRRVLWCGRCTQAR